MDSDYRQLSWDEDVANDCRALIRLALQEDLQTVGDLTSAAVVEPSATGTVQLVSRVTGIACGLHIGPLVLEELNCTAQWKALVNDGDAMVAGTPLAQLHGNVRDLLTAERPILNFISKLSGVATLTSQFVSAVEGTQARVYDTRKTTPGYRRIEKYAVGCGGGTNHRTGLYDGILIKDNHLAHMRQDPSVRSAPREAVTRARQYLESIATVGRTFIEIEVDTLEQFEHALKEQPDIILLDNMSCAQLATAVSLRNQSQLPTELEASGGVDLTTIREIAETGVERISVGALTHQATWLDIGQDWSEHMDGG